MLQQRDAVHEQVGCHLAGQLLTGAHKVIPCDAHGRLIAVFELLNQFTVTNLRRNGIMTGFGMEDKQNTHVPFEVGLRTDVVVLTQHGDE